MISPWAALAPGGGATATAGGGGGGGGAGVVALNSFVLREMIFASVKECTQFKPSLAKTAIALLGGTRVGGPSSS